MALNPPLDNNGVPIRVEGEYFVLERKDMEIEVKIDGFSKSTGKGKLYVTTARLVFVNKNWAKDKFKSFDMPLLNITDEKFEQPIFGANYLYIKVNPLFNLIPSPAKVKLWFMSGGCQKFLDVFLLILPQIRKKRQDGAENIIRDLNAGNLEKKYAYVDPSDPSVIFVTQPQNANTSSETVNQYYGSFGAPNYQNNLNYAPSYNTNTNTNMSFQNINQQQTMSMQPSSNMDSNFPNNYPPNYTVNSYSNNNQQQNINQYVQPQINPQFQNIQTFQNNTNLNSNSNNQQNPNQIQTNPNPNVGYYYGWWGPDLQRNY